MRKKARKPVAFYDGDLLVPTFMGILGAAEKMNPLAGVQVARQRGVFAFLRDELEEVKNFPEAETGAEQTIYDAEATQHLHRVGDQLHRMNVGDVAELVDQKRHGYIHELEVFLPQSNSVGREDVSGPPLRLRRFQGPSGKSKRGKPLVQQNKFVVGPMGSHHSEKGRVCFR